MRIWSQVWPNLLANALWVPLAAWWAQSRVRQASRTVEHLLREHRQELHLYLGNKPGRG